MLLNLLKSFFFTTSEHFYLEKDFRQMITLGIQWIHALHVLSYYTAVQKDCCSNQIPVWTEALQTCSRLSENPACLSEWVNVHAVSLSKITGTGPSSLGAVDYAVFMRQCQTPRNRVLCYPSQRSWFRPLILTCNLCLVLMIQKVSVAVSSLQKMVLLVEMSLFKSVEIIHLYSMGKIYLVHAFSAVNIAALLARYSYFWYIFDKDILKSSSQF